MARATCRRCGSCRPWTSRAAVPLSSVPCLVPGCGGRLEAQRRALCPRCQRASYFCAQKPLHALDGLQFFAGVRVPSIDACVPDLASEPALLAAPVREPLPPPTLEPAEELAERIRAAGAVVTVADVCRIAQSAAAEKYGPGHPLELVTWCARLLVRLMGDTPADRFGPNALRAVRRELLQQTHGPQGLRKSRREINRRVGVIRRIFKAASGFEVIPPSVHEGLRSLEPLRRGHTTARELPPIAPVDERVFEATLPFCSPTIAGMLRVQAATGCRSGELVAMRVCDIDRSDRTWVYRPRSHKNAWRGGDREIALGPRVRKILRPLLEGLQPGDFVFSPRREMARSAAEKRATRKSPIQPSQEDRRWCRRRLNVAERAAGEKYTNQSYGRAVARAAARAGVPHWRPYQLRHVFLTKVRNAHGIEAAQCVAGHASLSATEIYTRSRLERARALAEELG